MNSAVEDPEKSLKRRRRIRRTLGISTVLLLAHLLGFATSLHALMATRTAPGAVAWVVSLNAMPYLAVPTYWIFGRSKFQGYVTLRRKSTSELTDTLQEQLNKLQRFQTHWEDNSNHRLQAIENLARLPFTDGNSLELLIDGEAIFSSLFAGMDAAEDYLLVQFYIVKDDDLGAEFQRRLIARAQAGVRVYLMIDEIGSVELPRAYRQTLLDAGVELLSFQSTQGWGNKLQLNFRNHRKLVVADGTQAWLGGVNIGDEYRSDSWRDTHLRLEGPAVLHLQMSFLEDWRWAANDIPRVSWKPEPTEEPGVPVLILPTGPSDPFETASLMIQQLAHLAEDRLWLATPYFVPDEGVVAALKLAAFGGVDVRILIPETTDNKVVQLASQTYYDSLMAAGVQIYQYQGGMMHAKSFLVDDYGAAVSSANLDNRSFRLNFELTALVVDSTFAMQVAHMFEQDFSSSILMQADSFADSPLWYRVLANGANLFAPVL